MRRFINLCNYWFGLSLVATALWSELLSLLEGSANGVCAACSVRRSYVDLLRGAITRALVVNAILCVAINSVIVMLGLFLSANVSVFFHNFIPSLIFGILLLCSEAPF